ncbi:lactate racemase domain-containing protein [Desulfofustis glycolicus]|uniref:LarA-like N-terminal domain-containing protein n=1 Tax=Desulfofustis glycolicus DSM 9705 TaxID=1121409 RepID=A0A1M5UNV9_9BACT|nr:lactate racemase domain-containing protein [Desulfofustis glycolicus]MCB2217381.1 nickel-dependent lactate racemase [Desulfobulbaceae bacterium]SHH64657.1 protein of unknown function [Desulfofustis glycolicus DSM 9705]
MNYPRMAAVSQRLEAARIEDIDSVVAEELERAGLADRIRPGSRVAITAGSRGITDMTALVRAIVGEIRNLGAQPIIVPAMGSHGGATAAGQAELLADLGVSEARIGAPVISSMDVDEIGVTDDNIPVVLSSDALACDHILIVNRIKPHTEFSGRIESGLTKMMVIGLGKHQGAINIHNWAVRYGYEQTLISAGKLIIDRAPITLGIGLVENGYGQAMTIAAVTPERFIEEEARLLESARKSCPHLPFDRFDILIVDEAGKEISGTGMDTKVIGRIMNIYEPPLSHPHITRIVLRDLTATSHGNGLGIGLVDFITERVFAKLDRPTTDVNCITAVTPEKGRVPIVARTDRQAVEFAFASAGPVTEKDVRLCWIRNTAALDRFLVSEALLAEVAEHPDLKVCSPLQAMQFDDAGNLLPPP